MMMTFPNVIFQSVLMYCLHSGCVCRGKFEDCMLSYLPKVFSFMFNEPSLFADIFMLLHVYCGCDSGTLVCTDSGVLRLCVQ